MIGNVLRSRYQILRDLGKGGFGKTYLAKDLDMPGQNTCVVKQLIQHANPQTQYIARRLFQTEAETLHRLGKHDQIPSLFAYFEENGNFYLVQEFVDGHDLDAELPPGNRLSSGQTRRLLQEILEVLVFVHRQNVIHRDIKPSNLMRRNSDGKLVLIDFGSVKQIRAQSIQTQNKTQLTVGIYTEGYAPDEQILGKPKLASDIYAVGMVGIQALTGIQPSELPKDPNTEEVLWRHQATGVNPRLADVLSKMVRCHFRERYQNASEALQALGYRHSRPPLTAPPSRPNPVPLLFTSNPSNPVPPLFASTSSPLPSSVTTTPFPMPSPSSMVQFLRQGVVGIGVVCNRLREVPLARSMRFRRGVVGIGAVFLGGAFLWNSVSSIKESMEFAQQYAQLDSYLKNGQWKAADRKTTDLLLTLGDKDNSGWLSTSEMKRLSCNALKSIDQLWVQSSEGRFGFSVQKDIYLELGGTGEFNQELSWQFADRLGWIEEKFWQEDFATGGEMFFVWHDYNQLLFTLTDETPQGQLPMEISVVNIGRSFSLMWRLVDCSI